MTRSIRKSQGFTLVEILIVVVILGILAAIVIPQFTSASQSAKASSLTSQIQTIRSQLELCQIQHGGGYPDLAASGWSIMTDKTNPVSAYSTADADDGVSNNMVGPYLQQAPVNPFTGGSSVKADNSGDWKYTKATGSVVACLPTDQYSQISQLGLTTNDVVSK